MSDETTQFILGDAALDATSQRGRRRWFRWRKKPEKKLVRCENCEAPLTGPYCAQCGQHAIDYRRSLMTVLIDAADSFFDWDTKFLNTMVVLLTRPGRLTNDFNAGRRMRYMHPLRLYLLASIAFFLMARLINLAPSSPPEWTVADRAEVSAALEKLSAPDSPLNPEQRAKVEDALARITEIPDLTPKQRARLEGVVGRLPSLAEKEKLSPRDLRRLDALLALIPKKSIAPPPLIASPGEANAPPSGILPKIPAPGATKEKKDTPGIHFDSSDEEKNEFGKWLETRIKEKIGEDGTKAELFLDTLRSNIPTMMLFAVPLFAFVLKILYIFQRRYYIEHLVYALHIHSFAYLAAVVITLLGMGLERVLPAFQTLVVVALSLTAAVQVFLSIRRVYGQGWFFSIFKFFLGGVVYLVILSIGIGATAFITLLLPS